MISKDYALENLQLTEEEYEKLKQWYKDVGAYGKYYGAIGGELSFEIIPTSIGEIIIAKLSNGQSITLRDL